jgi:hypothetical protein
MADTCHSLLADDLVDHQADQLGAARHVRVDGHQGDAEAFGDLAHREGGQALRVGDRDARGDHLVDADPLLGAPGALRHAERPAPEQRQGPVDGGRQIFVLRHLVRLPRVVYGVARQEFP